MKMKVVIFGLGCDGISNAVLLYQNNMLIFFNIFPLKVFRVNLQQSHLINSVFDAFPKSKSFILTDTDNAFEALTDFSFVIVATPTSYGVGASKFEMSSVEVVTSAASAANPDAAVSSKSTIPPGFVDGVRERLSAPDVIFSREFLREGRALYDSLYPSRIIVGEGSVRARALAIDLLEGAVKKDVPVLFTGTREADAIKLLANTYLAMRVAYFNELNSHAMVGGRDTCQIIDWVCQNLRIGAHYNNSSLGYGGYCLAKDTKQLLATPELFFRPQLSTS